MGLPEMLALGLLGLVLACGLLWRRAGAQPDWERVTGKVVACKVRNTHYNATATDEKVFLTYAYTVDGVAYTASWEGYWPQVYSPNALPRDQVLKVLRPEYPLTILYDPTNPRRHWLHGPETPGKSLYTALFVASILAALFYYGRVYPVWRRRR